MPTLTLNRDDVLPKVIGQAIDFERWPWRHHAAIVASVTAWRPSSSWIAEALYELP